MSVTQLLNGKMAGWEQISPNFSPTEGGTSPISYMAQQEQLPQFYLQQRLTAHALIAAGAELRVPDARGLLPADYALMSPNTELVKEVVIATIEQFENRKGGQPYKPNIMAYFASTPASFNPDTAEGNPFDERERMNAFANLRRNHAVIGDILRDRARNHKDMTLRAMDDAQIGFWLKPLSHDGVRLSYGRLPRPPFELEELHGVIRAEASAPRLHFTSSARGEENAEYRAVTQYELLRVQAANDYVQTHRPSAF